SGRAIIHGMNIAETPLYETAGIIGSVFQNPRSQFFNLDTSSEVAFGCENLGLPENVIRERVRKTAADFHIEPLMGRNIFALSAGEKQKIACASVDATGPAIYVLDEPSSNLDEASTANLRLLLERWKTQGKTVVISEHRLHYLVGLADRVVYLRGGRIVQTFSGGDFFALSPDALAALHLRSFSVPALPRSAPEETPSRDKNIVIRRFHVNRPGPDGGLRLDIEELSVPVGKAVAVTGNNGAGKTTFARCLCGLEKKNRGTLSLGGKRITPKERLKRCYLVMQDVTGQLFTESVLDEVLLSMKVEDSSRAEVILASLDLLQFRNQHPQSLSGGQKQRLAIASAIASERDIIVLDEPTSGLDLAHMREVAGAITRLLSLGKTVFIITHDRELATAVCSHTIHMEKGKLKY
ncbi:MAG: energy-coupling factor ABC transporter ATP-binding protein, partial [Treponema sp.]|nr:energy-coupling factor ABC transporter ATP-binding protein [Treponema sp.]